MEENTEFEVRDVIGEEAKRISKELWENAKKSHNNTNQDREIKLDYITFKQLFYTLNIRSCKYSKFENEVIEDCKAIKIYYNECFSRNWIQLGWNDIVDKLSSWKLLERFLKPEILNSYVTDIYYNDEEEILEIYLEDEPVETLEEYNG